MAHRVHTVVIVNPASGRGRGARQLPAMRTAFARHGISEIRLTSHPGDEARVVREALADGANDLVIVGGDGTWGRCAGALLEAGAGRRVRLAFLTAGTGNDFAKNLGAPTHDPAAMALLLADRTCEHDVDAGAVESGGNTHWFLNVLGFGFDVAVLQDTARGGALGGKAVYIAAALKRLIGYTGFSYAEGDDPRVRPGNGVGGAAPRAETSPSATQRTAMMLVFSNGANFGGAFRIAPAARVDDGLLDQIEIGDVRGLARLPLFARALRGAHLTHPQVRALRNARFDLSFDAPPACDLDGELVQLGSRHLTVRSAPGALRVVAPGLSVAR